MERQATPGVKWSRSKCGCRWIPGMLQHCALHGAAPELLEALKDLRESIAAHSLNNPAPKYLRESDQMAARAILKATGGSK